MKRVKVFFHTNNRLLSIVAALFGGVVYLLQSWYYAHNLDSILDEGAYVLKGLLFVRGVYTPFQDYGPLTNHTPLAFIIPGLIQDWFGPGLRPARYFAVFVGVLILLGLWVLIRRLRGEGWAALAVWVIALNPAVIKMYSVATSQVLIACMLVWMLVCILGKDRSLWHLVIGAILAGTAMMTRINMAPVLPIIILYIWWQHGRRAAIWATVAGGSVILIGHLLYWPNILKLWTYWLPDSLTPFLDPWREPDAVRYWNPQTDFSGRVISFFHGFRFHFVTLLGAIIVWLLWPKKNTWKNQQDLGMVVVLTGLLLVLGGMHAYASLGLSYCVFCFPIYLSFFDFMGIIILIIALPHLPSRMSFVKQGIIVLLLLGLLAGMGYSAFADYKQASLDFLEQTVPRMRSFQILPGEVELGVLIENRFGTPVQTQFRYVPAFIGALIGLIFLVVVFAGITPIIHRKFHLHYSPGAIALALACALGLVFSPTLALGNGFQTYDCGQAENELATSDGETPTTSLTENAGNNGASKDVIQSYETVGRYLAEIIPPGSKIYWRGVLSTVPLLYLENPQLYPSQINQDYTIYLNGDDTALERYGFWSDSLGRKWLQEADYILVAQRYYKGWLEEALQDETLYRELPRSTSVAPCNPISFLHIFERLP